MTREYRCRNWLCRTASLHSPSGWVWGNKLPVRELEEPPETLNQACFRHFGFPKSPYVRHEFWLPAAGPGPLTPLRRFLCEAGRGAWGPVWSVRELIR